jgi:hypothetical protein
MTRSPARLLALSIAASLTACAFDRDTGLLDGGRLGPFDGGGAGAGPVDGGRAGCTLPDAGPEFQLTTLAMLCEEVSAGDHRLARDQAVDRALRCGEPFTELDLPHLPETIGPLPSPPSCARGELAANMHLYEGSIALGRIAYDESAAAACRAAGRASDGGTPIQGDSLSDPCARAIRGLVPIGGACGFHEECADGFCKPGALDSCGGSCAEPLGERALCEPRRDVCAVESDCRRMADDRWRCLARRERGESCIDGASCKGDLVCIAGRCGDKLGLNEVCFDGGSCRDDLVCVKNGGDTGLCARRASAGARCGDENDGFPRCESRCLVCAADGRCAARRGEGEACAADGDCLDAFYCTSDHACATRPRRGEACELASGHLGGNCLYRDDFCHRISPTEGFCEERAPQCLADEPAVGSGEPKKLSGEPCTDDEQCATGLCTANGRVCAVPCANGCIGNFLQYYGYLLFFSIVLRAKGRRDSRARRGTC